MKNLDDLKNFSFIRIFMHLCNKNLFNQSMSNIKFNSKKVHRLYTV